MSARTPASEGEPSSTALLVIDVQVDIFKGRKPAADWPQILERIRGLVTGARAAHVPVIFVQHDGPHGHRLQTGSPGWALDPRLDVRPTDQVVRKRACDAFHDTALSGVLEELGTRRLVVCGCWTDYCVDTTCRRAVSQGYEVTLVGDAHCCGDSDTLTAAQIIAHHNETLDGLDAGAAKLTVCKAADLNWS